MIDTHNPLVLDPDDRRIRIVVQLAGRPASALVIFVVLAVVHTWPLGTNPAHLSRNDNGDTLLNTWAIAWVAHQLPRDPAHLFDANIFHPERHTLGYSEAMIVQGILAMPVLASGGSPVLAYNLVLLAGFALTGWAFWLLVNRWTGSHAAAYVSGCLAAFNSHVLVRLPHLQAQHVEFVALVLFALDRLLVSRRARDAMLLGAGFALQGLTSVYLLVFTAWMLVFACAARKREWLRRDARRALALLAVAVATAVLILAPYLAGYLEVHRLQGFERSIEDGRRFAATWADYLTTGSRFHYGLWSQPFFERALSATFPGVTALILVALALMWPDTRHDRRLIMCLAVAVGCAAISFSPHTPFYPWLYRAIPLFRAVRVQAHLGHIVLLMIAIMAGFGVEGLLLRCRLPQVRIVVSLVAFGLVNLEALRAPLDYAPFSSIPPVYSLLARQPAGAIVELPFFPPVAYYLNASYMLASTKHWRPMLNGYSGFRPDSYDATFSAIQNFPSVEALLELKARGVTDIVVHTEMIPPNVLEAAKRVGSLQLLAEEGTIEIYRLR